MPLHGGLTPGFERYGGGAPALKIIVDSIGAQRGTLYDTAQPSNVYLENMAIGRAIAECWSNNQRMANQWDSARMSEFIPRWENILGLHPLDTDTDTDRRARISKSFARITQSGIYQTVYDQLRSLLGSTIFGGIITTGTNTAGVVVWNPVGQTAVTGGLVDVSQHDATGALTFYSSIAHILIQVTQPAGVSDGAFYSTVAQINPMLDSLLPAWVTWDWARNTSSQLLHTIPISAISDTSPVVVTTNNQAPAGVQHGFVVGQSVTIAGSNVSAYNGTWAITAVGGTTSGGTGTTFTLTAGAPPTSGTGGAFGTASAPGFYLDGDPSMGGVQTNPNTSTLINTDNESLTP